MAKDTLMQRYIKQNTLSSFLSKQIEDFRHVHWYFTATNKDRQGMTDLEYRLYHGIPLEFFRNAQKPVVFKGPVKWRRWSTANG